MRLAIAVCLCSILTVCCVAKQDVQKTQEWLSKYEEFVKVKLPTVDPENPPIPKEQVKFFVFSNSNLENPIEISLENIDAIDKKIEKLFVLVHGWMEHRNRPWYEDLKNALLSRFRNSIVIQVDYSEPAFDYYPNSVSAAKYVGRYTGEILMEISKRKNISTKKIIMIGHSLGSHVSGIAAKTIQKNIPRISRIIALDPAKPPYEDLPCEKRLCKTDADVVVAIHTDVGRYGYGPPIGKIDFYPNGGRNQKGCPVQEFKGLASEDTMCNHWRSWEYMIEAIKNKRHFNSIRCDDWTAYKENHCDKQTITMGDMEATVEGSFFLLTNEKPPYAIEAEKDKKEL